MSKKINWRTLSIALVVIIVLFFIIVVIDSCWTSESVWKAPIFALISAIQTTALAVAIWDFVAKKEFAQEILNLAHISNNITESGITYIYGDFLTINWNEILELTNKLIIAVSYANTWREANRIKLAQIASSKDALTVYLPDYGNNDVLTELSRRFNITVDDVYKKIKESSMAFRELGATVFLYSGSFQTSFYLADNEAIMAVFKHKKQKSTVPAIRINKSGGLYSFIESELEAIKNNSKMEEILQDDK